MSDPVFSHLIEIDEARRQLRIYRLLSDGSRQLYTEVDLPVVKSDADKALLDKFFHMLGENILLDSPTARRMLNI
jgi:hypothetical protein